MNNKTLKSFIVNAEFRHRFITYSMKNRYSLWYLLKITLFNVIKLLKKHSQ